MSTSSVSIPRERDTRIAWLTDYVELSKPRIGFMVLITVAVSYWVACWGRPDVLTLGGVLLGTLLVASSASALNQWLEWRRDALMDRTASRPLPTARLGTRETWAFATVTLLLGSGQLLLVCGPQPLAWALLSWLLYVAVYTPVKAWTPLNTAVGALSGAMPTLIGWSAAGAPYDLCAVSLYLTLFFWQFPHFMAIAWMYRRQYAKAGMRMWSVVDPSGLRAGFHAVLAAAALLPVTIIPAAGLPGAGKFWYVSAALLLGVGQLACALAFFARLDDHSARRLLRASLLYLPTLLLLLGLAFLPW